MGNDIQKGTTYAEGGVGGAGTVNADNLNAHVDESRIKASFISSKSLRDPATLSDSIVVEAGGVLYRETFQQVVDLISSALTIPIGVIMDFAGANPPGGWLMCFGQAVSRTTYSDLYGVIGITWGSGNGVDTFNLPDLRGRVAAGRDDMGGTGAGRLTTAEVSNPNAVNGNGGSERITLNVNMIPTHAHGATSTGVTNINSCAAEGGTTQGLEAGGSFGGRVMITRGANEWAVSVGTTVQNFGGGGPHGNLQPTVIVNKIIRYQ